ncbi:hypothetical protein D3C85_492380 [compost metagenome]
MLHLAVLDDLVLDLVGQVDGNRERQTLEATRAAVDLGVDAHDFAAVVEQRAAGVAGVDRHVRLDERDRSVVGQRTALGADDARGGGVLQAVGRADGQHPFAHLQLVDVARLHHRQVLRFDLDDGYVRLRIRAQHLGLVFAPVGHLHGHFLGVLDHVRVGQDDAVLADDEAGAFAPHRHFAIRCAAAGSGDLSKELRQGIIALRGGHLARAAHADVDDGRAEVARDLREIGGAGCADCLGSGGDGRRVGRHRNTAGQGGGARAADGAGGQQRQDKARGLHLLGLHVGSCVHV